MKLNDPYLIEQTMETFKSEVEVMYWIVEDALYEGKQVRALRILELLMYIGKYKPELIQSGLQPVQRTRLKEITHEIYENVTTQRREAITIKQPIQSRKIPFKLEKDLQKHLFEHKDILEDALGERLHIVGLEVETDGDYRCDVVAESLRKFYPIELKIAQSTHAVEIQGVVISSGFDAWSINEIRRAGHWIYTIKPLDSENKITLERIY